MPSREVTIERDVELNQVSFSIYNKVGAHSAIEDSSFGRYSYYEPYAMVQNTITHSFVDIVRNVRIGVTQHPLQRPTTHHITYRRRMYGVWDMNGEVFFEQCRSKLTEIGHDVWIGHDALIEAGVKVGDGAVIGSGTIVTHDVPPYAIVAGVPAKILRFRFDCEQTVALLDIAWWNWEDAVFRSRIDDFSLDIDISIHKYRKG